MTTFDEIFKQAIAALPEAQGTSANDLNKAIQEATPELVNDLADWLLDTLKKRAPKMLRERRGMHNTFNKNNLKRWKKPFDLLEMHYVICEELGSEFTCKNQPTAAEQQNYRFEALVSLHARAMLIANEIICLLKNGFADGAMGRWRTLHEAAVVAQFLAQAEPVISERYLASFHVQAYKAMRQYQEHHERANLEPFSEDDIRGIEHNRDTVITRYGKNLANDYGWASPELQKEKPTLFDLEVAVRLDHWRPRYRWASQYNHVAYKPPGTFLGLAESEEEVLLIGPSNSGLIDPAQMTAISMIHVTEALLRSDHSLDKLVLARTLLNLSDEIGHVFLETERQTFDEHKSKTAASAGAKDEA
tara:strand:+ start:430 stop:1512 length:1083 start_codon:yes stop_codon:yes gene_type:complete